MGAKKVYGIDLGTTYSCIARVDEHGRPEVINNSENLPTTPSVVYFESEGNIVVGQTAKDVARMYSDDVVSAVKRLMGLANIEFSFFNKTLKPPEISAYILLKLVNDAAQVTGEKIEDVVITCPAYFGVEQRKATEQAGTIAGLNVRSVIPEPTAAAIAYGMEQEKDQVILVYDLGGGTFDITLIDLKENEINVIATGGDDQLGGLNWDEAIVDYFAHAFQEQIGTSAETLLDDPEACQELRNDAEKAKVALSSKQKHVQPVRCGTARATVELTRAKFDEITSSYLERTISLTKEVLARVKDRGYAKIDTLLLVGGSTYMPQVKERLSKEFSFEIRQHDPNLAVAKGAALFGHKCYLEDKIAARVQELIEQAFRASGTRIDETTVREKVTKQVATEVGMSLPALKSTLQKRISNVASKSFGIVVMVSEEGRDAERVANLIVKDQRVPVEVNRTFGTFADGQTGVTLQLKENEIITAEGESIDPARCTKDIGVVELTFERPLPKGSPVEVTFRMGEDARLFMEARNVTTGREIKADFVTDVSKEEEGEAQRRALSMKVS